MIISKIQPHKAEQFVKLLLQIDRETKFMLFEENERVITTKDMEARLGNSPESTGIFIGAEDENELVGFLSVSRGNSRRSNHTAYIAVGIIQKCVNKGIGRKLFEEVEKWAMKYNVTRLEITVLTHNEGAIRLYEKLGFKIEGRREKSMIIDGEYKSEYYMAKLINL